MSNEAVPAAPDSDSDPMPQSTPESSESFADVLRQFEQSHAQRPAAGARQLNGRVVSVAADRVFLDIGYKTEGVLARSAFEKNAELVQPGDLFPVSVTGRNEEGYYQLSRFQVALPRDWSALEAAFAGRLAVTGTVTAVVKGGATVDIGVRAFMPASRSGARDAAELERLVGTEINCRITKLDVADEDVVVDRRAVLEEQALSRASDRFAAMREGETVAGTVRSLMSYGAFVDLGGVDGLLHVSDISWARVNRPEEVLEVGQQLQLRVLKIDPESRRISLGLKQLEPEPWEAVPSRYAVNERVKGTVTRLTDFGAFVELEPGVEGMIHVSEMSWGRKVRHPGDVVREGDRVEAIILAVKPEERRISLGLKQTLTDPWLEVPRRFPVDSRIEGPVTRLTRFGAFVELAEGIEGLVHVSEISAERRIHHPSDVLHAGQIVQARVLGIDTEKHQIRLSIKQLAPTGIDEYLQEHKPGDVVSGRVVDESWVELGEGIRALCVAAAPAVPQADRSPSPEARADLSSLSSMLAARWKGSAPAPASAPEPLRAGQIRSFRIVKLDPDGRRIEVEAA